MKKIIKIVSIVFLSIILLLVITPFIFKDKITTIIKEELDNSFNTEIQFSDIGIGLITSFPKLSINIEDILLKKEIERRKDTLFYAKEISIKVSLNTLFKSENETIDIDNFRLESPRIKLMVSKDSIANYDFSDSSKSSKATKGVTKKPVRVRKNKSKSKNKQPKTASRKVIEKKPTTNNVTKVEKQLAFSLKNYEINNLHLSYIDKTSNMEVEVANFFHSGEGDFTETMFNLDTKTNGLVSFKQDKVQYLTENKIGLNAKIGVNLEENMYTFLENEFYLNNLALNFNGYVKLNETDTKINLKFSTPKSTFKSFLELIPETYAKPLVDVQTKGKFSLDGKLDGVLNEKNIPKFVLNLLVDQAMFKHPELPKGIEEIFINTKISNRSGNINDTEIDVSKLAFQIDRDKFNLTTKITNPIENPHIVANFNGTVNLANVSKAYPIEFDQKLEGIISTRINADFDMKAVENKQYDRVKLSGNLKIKNINYSSEYFPNPFVITKTELDFEPRTVKLITFKAKTGASDVSLKGELKNLLGYLLKDEKLVSSLSLQANKFVIEDFVALEESIETKEPTRKNKTSSVKKGQFGNSLIVSFFEKEPKVNIKENKKTDKQFKMDEPEAPLAIPKFFTSQINASIKEVVYDGMKLRNLNGKLVIKNGDVFLNKLAFNMFEGAVVLDGSLKTKANTTSFSSNMKIAKLNINKSFTQLEAFKKIAPIASSVQGKFDADVTLNGQLDKELAPKTKTLIGKMQIKFIDTQFLPNNSKTLSQLNKDLPFLNLQEVNLNNLKIDMKIKDSKVHVAPFTIKYNRDISIKIKGYHGFDSSMKYMISTDLPISYLGEDVATYTKDLTGESAEKIKVPLNIELKGTFAKPSVKVGMEQAKKKLKQEVKKQAKKAVKKEAKKQIQDLLNQNLPADKNGENAKIEKEVKKKANELLNSIFGN